MFVTLDQILLMVRFDPLNIAKVSPVLTLRLSDSICECEGVRLSEKKHGLSGMKFLH